LVRFRRDFSPASIIGARRQDFSFRNRAKLRSRHAGETAMLPGRMKRKAILSAAALVVLILLVVGGVKFLQVRALIDAGGKGGKPPETVSTVAVEADEWVRTVDSVGSVRAAQGADLSVETSGIVSKILFENGAEVQAGDLLLELDSTAEQAGLRAAEAEAELARTIFERTKSLRTTNAVPQSELDSAGAQIRKATARVEELRAAISKKQIRAPFAGRLGIREVNVGQFVQNGDKIVPLQSLDPIHVNFLLPQQLVSAMAAGQRIILRTDAQPGREFEGVLTAVNSEIDPVTRNIRLQGTLKNSDGALRPGMFARVEVFLGGADKVLRVPLTAVFRASYGDSVFVVQEKTGDDGVKKTVVEQRFIRTGRTKGDFIAVTEGLAEGDTVVSAGAFKLRNGSTILINNSLAPKPSASPNPENT
jgi:membrane fusion protein (multidrug efflux system)